MGFDVSKWNKQRYLAEAGEELQNPIAKAINNALPENLGYKEFAKAVARVLKDEYGSQNFKSFMNVLHDELGMEPLKEEAEESTLEKIASELKLKYPELKFDPTSDRIDVFGDENDKVTFANAERETKFEDGYRMFDVEDDDRGYMVRIVKNK
jgi:sulfite reductase beta subunit-like hemoprotein